MNSPNDNSTTRRRWRRIALLLVAIAALCQACMIVRPGPPQGGGGGGGGDNNDAPDDAVVDMLVLTQLDRSSGNLADAYTRVIRQLEGHLGEHDVTVRRAALAPLHRRSGEVVPIIFGRGEEGAEFGSMAEAMAFYAMDSGAEYIQQVATGESENLAALGLDLDERAVYHPTSADPSARAYFGAPADGLLVVVLSATPRLCSPDDPACALDGVPPADYFTTRASDDSASWLTLSGTGSLAPDKVFHAAIVTAEGVSSTEFDRKCRGYENFPTGYLDFMQGSQTRYYVPLADAVRNAGGQAAVVDLCKALSGESVDALDDLSKKIARAF